MENNTKIQIGERINAALASANMMQKELAKAIGVQDNSISYFVSGSRVPNTEQIIKIANVLNVSSDYLLGLTDAPTTDKDLRYICDYTGLSEKAVNVLHDYKSCFKNYELGDPYSMIDTVSALLESFDIRPYEGILHMITSYPVNGFDTNSTEAEHLARDIEDFMGFSHFNTFPAVSFSQIIETAYTTKIYQEIALFKKYQVDRFHSKPHVEAPAHITFYDLMKERNLLKSPGENDGND